MAARDPNVRRALVTSVAEDGETARVLIEWMKMMRGRDKGAIQGEVPMHDRGFQALAIPGVKVGDEVLVDLRPLPVVWLSFLFFVLPVLGFAAAALAVHGVSRVASMHPALIVVLQVGLGFAASVSAYLYADGVQRALKQEGRGTPLITAIMPRFMGEVEGAKDPSAAFLQAVFFLDAPASDTDWAFASSEFERIAGVQEARLEDDRVEIVFQNGVIKEKHLLELLTMFGFQVAMDRDPE